MKVGLVPLLYNEYNYGGVLQFYALQHILRTNGIVTDILFFDNEEKICEIENKNANILHLKQFAYFILHCNRNYLINKNTKRRNKKIDLFKEKYYSQLTDTKSVNYDEYDAVICGSDQIWNPLWARKRCFLTFVPDTVNKIIYAASLGCEKMTEQEKQVFKPAIERLQHVSVREYSAQKILSSFIENKDIPVVLDPTLLLSADEWRKIMCPYRQNGYVFTYFLGEYREKINLIKNFAAKRGLKIVNIPFASGETLDSNHFGDKKIIDADPSEFLGLIYGAEYVFTDSFHACVFSVLFKKQFFVFERDNSKKMQGRIETLLKNFDLPSRNITINTNIELVPKLVFDKNEQLQNNMREKSLEYLFGGIQNEVKSKN